MIITVETGLYSQVLRLYTPAIKLLTSCHINAQIWLFNQDEVTFEPGEAAVSVLASATLLLLDGLTAQCVALMTETVNVRNVLAYLGAAKMYGQRELEEVS